MFGDRLKRLRTERKITQSELGKLFGISSSTIGMYEQNRREPDAQTLIKIAEYFEVSTDYLLGNDEKPSAVSEQKNKPLSDEDAKLIIAIKDLENRFAGTDLVDENGRIKDETIDLIKELALNNKAFIEAMINKK
jgi:transcriptional regulator with XRE-family HTH domain